MKKLLLLFAVCALLVSCSSGNTPRAVAEKFSIELSKGNIDKASEYCTPEAAAMLAMAKSFGGSTEMVKEDFKFVFKKEEIEGDTAKVYFEDENGEEEEIDLVKLDGKWKVVLTK